MYFAACDINCLKKVVLRSLTAISRRFYSLGIISKTNKMNRDKCYFRYMEKEGKVDITFLLMIKNSIRQFNFSRNPTETIETLFSRIGTNVQKAFKGRKKSSSNENCDINVKFVNFTDRSIQEQATCLDLFSAKGPVYIQIHDHTYEAVFNSPWVLNINLPQCILAGFAIYPENFEVQYANNESCRFNWYKGMTVNERNHVKSDEHVKWELVGENFKYVPETQDIGYKLKLECIPGMNGKFGPAVETISKNVVEAGPGKCPFETRHMFTTSNLGNNSVRCVTYNILADLYCDSDFTRTSLHPYCPPYALHIDYRKVLILKELIGYNADIICLQEVDTKIFNNYLKPLLQNEDLKGVFYRKGNAVAEGLALFFRNNRFEIVGEEHIVLSEALKEKECLQSIWNGVKDNKLLKDRLQDRSTVASATYLQFKENPKELLIVANTHLYFHPDADHIRLIQGGIIIYWLNDIRDMLKKKFPEKNISLLLCGDFNSVPSCGIYQLFTSGIAPSTLEDWKSNKDEAIENVTLQQNHMLASAYGTPPFTNFTAGFADCLDYIYYEKSKFKVEQVVPLPSLEELQANTALPSVVFPSDHIALIADLKIL